MLLINSLNLINEKQIIRFVFFTVSIHWSLSGIFQILSRSKPAAGPVSGTQQTQQKKQLPKLEDFLKTRDYTGALSLLEVFFL
jgi:hypothetical protein